MTDESTQVADLTMEAVFEAALAEAEGLASDADVDSDSPADETNVEVDFEQTAEDDSDVDTEQAEDTFDFEEFEEEEVKPADAPIDLNRTVPVEGHGEVSIEELRNGYMMQADYTRGKQALKAEREQFAREQEAAAKIMESLESDPVGLAAYLAVETGLLQEQDLQGKDVSALRERVKVPKAEEIEAEIQRKVEERLNEHPVVREARIQQVRNAIDAEFRQIEQSVGKPLSEKARIRVIEYAREHDLNDLTVAFDALSAAQARKREQSAKLKAAATQRPATRGDRTSAPQKADTVEDALALALALHGE